MIQCSLLDLKKLDQNEGAANDDCNLVYWSPKAQALCYLSTISLECKALVCFHRGKRCSAISDSADGLN